MKNLFGAKPRAAPRLAKPRQARRYSCCIDSCSRFRPSRADQGDYFAFLLPNAQKKSAGSTFRRNATALFATKKAEGAIIGNLIIFIGVMALAGATVAIFKTIIDDNTNEVAATNDRTVGVMKTNFDISTASYDSGVIYVYVKNTGAQQFDPDDLDIYIDDVRVPRDVLNRTVTVTADTDTINTGIWDQKEELEFNVFITYVTPETHDVRVATPNGVKADGEFSS